MITPIIIFFILALFKIIVKAPLLLVIPIFTVAHFSINKSFYYSSIEIKNLERNFLGLRK